MKLFLMALGMALLILSSVDTVRASDTCHIGYHGPHHGHHGGYQHKGHHGGNACHFGHCHH